jgi:hypothetical protein
LNAWEAKWKGESKLNLAKGEAESIAYQEMGRAEGQADIIRSIIKALESINLSPNQPQNVRNVVLAHIAQVIEAMTITESRKGSDNIG